MVTKRSRVAGDLFQTAKARAKVSSATRVPDQSGEDHRKIDNHNPNVPLTEPDDEEVDQMVSDNTSSRCLSTPRHSDDPRIQDIMALARERTYWLQMRLRNTARIAAEMRRYLQPIRSQEETWADETKTKALEMVATEVELSKRELVNAKRTMSGKKLLKTTGEHTTIGPLLLTAVSLAEWEIREDEILERMCELAASLDIAPFVDSPDRKGFTFTGLSILVGHAGHPLDYPKKGHLWKRLGLAPYQKDNVTRAGSTWGRVGGLRKEDWILLGYKRSRLGDIFGKITQPLLYAQWRSTGPIGPYGAAYGAYKLRQKELNEAGMFLPEAERQAAAARKAGKKPQKALLEGKLSDSQINARALRYMTKKLVADLWGAWRLVGKTGEL